MQAALSQPLSSKLKKRSERNCHASFATNEVAAKPMSVDDAAIAIGDSNRDFLVFRNSDTERLNVVYKRKDGNIGWIEPEA